MLVPRPLPQLKLWLPLVPQVYTYAPLLAALVLWSVLTSPTASPMAAVEPIDRDADAVAPEISVSAA